MFFFFCCAPSGAATFRRGQSKKKHHPGCFSFCSGPGKGRGRRSPVGRRHRARAKKKTPRLRRGGVFLFAAAPLGPGWCFFLLWPRPDTSSLTVGWGDFGKAGWCFFFCCGPAVGGVFFFCCGPARTLTHSLRAWVAMPRPGGATAKKETPRVVFFFLLRPRRVFLDNSKKCLGYYIGSKKTRRGHSKKKKHHFRSISVLWQDDA